MGWGLSQPEPGPAGALAGVHTPSGALAAAGHISPCPEGINGAAPWKDKLFLTSPRLCWNSRGEGTECLSMSLGPRWVSRALASAPTSRFCCLA